MQTRRRFGAAVLVAAVALLLAGGGQAWAGFVPLPATLDTLEPAGNFTTVQGPNELDTFRNFTYAPTPATAPPPASAITVSAFLPGSPFSNFSGLAFQGLFAAAANTTVDYDFSYVVTPPQGFEITQILLQLSGFNNGGGTGQATINETLTNGLVTTHVVVVGGSNGANFSNFNEGFASVAVPAPPSVILLGIGALGLLGYGWRRRRQAA
jgi:hypothetical protein